MIDYQLAVATIRSAILALRPRLLAAYGKIEGVICNDPYEQIWDIAPGALLIEEAGGIVCNLQQDTYDPGNLNVIAATRDVYRTLRAARLV